MSKDALLLAASKVRGNIENLTTYMTTHDKDHQTYSPEFQWPIKQGYFIVQAKNGVIPVKNWGVFKYDVDAFNDVLRSLRAMLKKIEAEIAN